MMVEICDEDKSSEPYFLDSEYARAIAEVSGRISRLDLRSDEAEALDHTRSFLKYCREDDRQKRFAKRAMRSCKDLVREHRAATESAWRAVESGDVAQVLATLWGERYRAPLEKCLASMKCRLGNQQDMDETVAVYRQIVDEMETWLLAVKGIRNMKICGSTLRDVRDWCTTREAAGKEGQSNPEDWCTNGAELMNVIRWFQQIRIRTFPSTPPGGTVQG
ncbi:hypothetical protein sos41_08320 [Alphaproteobacteria bacterium SO-S41]|nr:hypothetical protein sos41_08320 [Alphaproteobacteria bacterium SO-S41]